MIFSPPPILRDALPDESCNNTSIYRQKSPKKVRTYLAALV